MDSDDYVDPDLIAAIEASLQDQETPSYRHQPSSRSSEAVVDLTGDSDDKNLQTAELVDLINDQDEDEDLKRAIGLSMQEQNSLDPQPQHLAEQDTSNNKTAKSRGNDDQTVVDSAQSSFSIFGINRQALEEERLARVAKRKAEQNISPPSLSRERKVARYQTVSNTKESDLAVSSAYSDLSTLQKGTSGVSRTKETVTTPVAPSASPASQFPKGVVKKTWVFGCTRKGDDIKIEEVLQGSDLELAVLSAFQWDMEWLFTKLSTKKGRFLLVMQAKEESTKRQYEMETAGMSNLRLCFPPMEGQVNCMHSKLMLLFHPTYLRIVVPSANLVPYDWGESGGVMENTVFLIDLPKLSESSTNVVSKTSFYEDLVYFLKASTLHDNIITKLSSFDFSETARYAFVHTIGGSHAGEAWRRTGHCGLGKAVASLGLQSHKPTKVDFVTSSVGSLTDEFLRSIYLSSQGDDGLTEYTLRNSKTFPTKRHADPNILIQKTAGADWKENFRVYFPSEQTVNASKGGSRCAGTICFQEKWYSGAKFPKNVLRDCISRRPGLLMHNKMLFARPATPISLPDGSICDAWCYVGSANLSESAWGRLVQDRTTKGPKLNCRNWECGVLVPVIRASSSSEKDEQKHDIGDSANTAPDGDIAEVFENTVPVPMRVPAPAYDAGRKPWFGMFG